ncbi:MAG: hypothetical protein K5892_08110 [Acholeplasmatales bacterium]|nr:hypothetical protein [Acholeplasmatales bacterium]
MNKIKAMLKEAAARQEIHDVDKNYIISNIDTNKVLNSKPKTVRRPYKRLIPLFASLVLVVGVVLSISLYFGLRSNDKPNNEVIYNDEFLAKLEEFYEETTVSEANNMINVVNTFESVSFDVVPISKPLIPEMEVSIVNDTHTFINNFENMYNIKSSTATLIENSIHGQYNKTIEVSSNDFIYYMYFNENLVEEKNVEGLNYKYKSEIEGQIISGSNQYSFSGIKRIKNSILEYEMTIIINDNYHIDVKEKFPVNSDLSIKYTQFNFDYNYYNGDKTKKVRIEQKFGDKPQIRFVANEFAANEFKMTITKLESNSLQCKIDSSDGTLLYINISEEGYNYKFKYKDKEKTSNEYNK